jgi:hypothetical protein
MASVLGDVRWPWIPLASPHHAAIEPNSSTM